MADIDVQYMKKNKLLGVLIFSLCVFGIVHFQYDKDDEINKIIIVCLIMIVYYFINIYFPSYHIVHTSSSS